MSAFNRVTSDMEMEDNNLGLPQPSFAYNSNTGTTNFDLSSSLSSPPRPNLKSPGVRRHPTLLGGELSSSFGESSVHSSNSFGDHGPGLPKQRNMVYADRYIPSRSATDLEGGAFDHIEFDGSENQTSKSFSSTNETNRESKAAMNSLLRTELLGMEGGMDVVSNGGMMGANGPSQGGSSDGGTDRLRSSTESIRSTGSSGGGGVLDMRGSGSFTGHNVLKFRSDRRRGSGDSGSISSNNSASSGDSNNSNISNNSILSGQSNLGIGGVMPGSPTALSGLGSSIRKAQRKISKTPYKVLDAPALQDDYYLNLLDWSSSNVLSVALGSNVYLWSACNSKVTKLCDTGADNLVTSICWSPQGTHLAVGTNSGKVQLWDVQENSLIRETHTHASRVGTMAWSSGLLATGSRDRTIMCHDARIRGSGASDDPMTIGSTNASDPSVVHEFTCHKQEVCGLKWSPDEKMLASGGNDNKLYIWSLNQGDPCNPLCRFSDHNAAVKAVAWSPHQNGLLASGGGTADRNIRFWNTLTGMPLHRIDTGSQVCNLMWSKNVNEIVSTHGYSLNQIIVWKYPSMQKVATLTGHSLRVLYLAMSPDGQSVVTGAGDETLRFWNLFPGARNSSGFRGTGLLLPGSNIR